jgi:hypothetical protein
MAGLGVTFSLVERGEVRLSWPPKLEEVKTHLSLFWTGVGMDGSSHIRSPFGSFGGVEESWMISQVSRDQREAGKPGKEVELVEDQVP